MVAAFVINLASEVGTIGRFGNQVPISKLIASDEEFSGPLDFVPRKVRADP